MRITDKRNVMRRITAVRKLIVEEISHNSLGGKIAAGLSNEGFAGGYLQALDDVEAALRHGYPSDHRGYWRRADRSLT